jgi:hypothetical protein
MIDLRQLAAGFTSQPTPGANIPKAELIQAVATVEQPRELVQVANPANYSAINMQNLQKGNDNLFQGTLRNESGSTRNLIIGGLFSLQGEYQAFNLLPSAVDFATVIELTSLAPSNTGIFQGLNTRLKQMPAVFSKITIQTDVASQSNQSITTGFITKALKPQENTLFSPVCDACQNNNVTIFTKEFNGVFMAGRNNYISIPLVAMVGAQFATIRLEYAGEEQIASLTQQGLI